MTKSIGLDIGGTKIAGAFYNEKGAELAQVAVPTPQIYEVFIEACANVVAELEKKCGKADSVGAGICGAIDRATGRMKTALNLSCANNRAVKTDLEKRMSRKIALENDAVCMALAEAMEGAGKGYPSVFGLILGTGVGGGFILDGKIVVGANGTCGEVGHLPLPSWSPADGERRVCGCGRDDCVEAYISGPSLARLYEKRTGKKADAKKIGELAKNDDKDALEVLDIYYTLVAKAMTVILHTFDPHVITVSGGLNALPGLYDEVPKRWGQYAICRNPKTKFVPAKFGAMAGLRGAAWLGKDVTG